MFRLTPRRIVTATLSISPAGCAFLPGRSAETVAFVIPLSIEDFSPAATVRLTIWDEEGARRSRANADCSISHDVQTGQDTIACPPGVAYQAVQPEEFSFPVQALAGGLTVTSQTVHVGEQYAILISGLSQDNCNSASARYEGRALSPVVTLEVLEWSTTLMACP